MTWLFASLAATAPRSSMAFAAFQRTTAFAWGTQWTTSKTTKATTTRLLSSTTTPPPMPYGDDKMPFYALGTNLAIQVGGQANFKTLLEADEMDVVLEAFCDTLRGESTIVDTRTVLSTYGPQLNKILQERTSRIMDLVKKDGADFVTNFLDCTEEAVQTDSGLVYYEMVAGTGAQPTIKSNVEVHYHGTLIDGTVFDSSVDRGQTISFPLGGVIRGWQEGLQMMKEGGKATLVIPGDLAYGDAGSGDGTSVSLSLCMCVFCQNETCSCSKIVTAPVASSDSIDNVSARMGVYSQMSHMYFSRFCFAQ
jgi:FKBP-type peptidyl-prolyl cis-trans isomerase FkpA